MEATMQDAPLTLDSIVRRGAELFGDSTVVTLTANGTRRASFAEVAARADRLGSVMRSFGVREGDAVGTLLWNQQEHMEAYLAVPRMGAVLHTLNLRLSPEQLAFVINHGGDRVVIVDESLAPLLAAIRPQLTTVEHVLVVGDTGALDGAAGYAAAVDAAEPLRDWPHLDERAAAGMCYTTGTTGDPKGVVYSHRSQYLHSLAVWANLQISEHDRMLFIVPMFHANAWGMPYVGWMVGADLLFPGRFLQPEPLARFIAEERATFGGGVPTVLSALLQHADSDPSVDLSSLRLMVCGGSAVPRSLMEAYQQRHGVRVIQAWGMTETSPIGAIAWPPRGATGEDEMAYRCRTGRAVPGVEIRVVGDDGAEVAHDGTAVGEIEVRGPWITARYHGVEAPERFHDGWLRTGDVATIDSRGYLQITDRAKDVIKSGGEWISSVELENELTGHPSLVEAAVIGVPDQRWDERPLALVVPRQGERPDAAELREWLAERVPKWWLPERWAIVEELPKTSVGKLDKKRLRAAHAAGELPVVELEHEHAAR